MWKTLTVITILLAGSAAALRYLGSKDAELDVTLLKRSEENVVSADEHLQQKKAELTASETKRDETSTAANDEETKRDKSKSDEEMTKTEKSNIESEVTTKKAELANLEEQLKDLGGIEELMAKVESLEAQSLKTKTELAIAKSRFKSLVSTEAAVKKRIVSLKDNEAMQQSGKMVTLSTRVSQTFNDWGFVVIGAGGRQNVVAGTALEVTRGGEVIANLRVTNLEANLAACDIESTVDGALIGVGDRVRVASESTWVPGQAETAAATATSLPGAEAGASADPSAPSVPTPEEAGDPFGGAPAPAPEAPAEDDPFGLGGADPDPAVPEAPAEPEAPSTDDDPFGIN